jgi:hypothetical protein
MDVFGHRRVTSRSTYANPIISGPQDILAREPLGQRRVFESPASESNIVVSTTGLEPMDQRAPNYRIQFVRNNHPLYSAKQTS